MTDFNNSKLVLNNAPPVASEYKIHQLEIAPPNMVRIMLQDDLGQMKNIYFRGNQAETVIAAINRGNFSGDNKPLAQRLMDYIVAEGMIDGTTETSA